MKQHFIPFYLLLVRPCIYKSIMENGSKSVNWLTFIFSLKVTVVDDINATCFFFISFSFFLWWVLPIKTSSYKWSTPDTNNLAKKKKTGELFLFRISYKVNDIGSIECERTKEGKHAFLCYFPVVLDIIMSTAGIEVKKNREKCRKSHHLIHTNKREFFFYI